MGHPCALSYTINFFVHEIREYICMREYMGDPLDDNDDKFYLKYNKYNDDKI